MFYILHGNFEALLLRLGYKRQKLEPWMIACIIMTIFCYLYCHFGGSYIETLFEKLLWIGASMAFCLGSVFIFGLFLGLTIARKIIKEAFKDNSDLY